MCKIYRVFSKYFEGDKYYDLYGKYGEFYQSNYDCKIKQIEEFQKKHPYYEYKVLELTKEQTKRIDENSDIYGIITDDNLYKELFGG